MGIITTAAQDYIGLFSQYLNQFLTWGQWLFFSLLTINLSIACLWYAFDSESFHSSVAKFIRQFFVITIFYTIMVNHIWLIQICETALQMGKTVTGMPRVDPSSIIENGFAIANNLIHPVISLNPFKIGTGVLIMLACYFVIIFCFISIALNLAVTLITCQLWITISTFFLGFAALDVTRDMARNVLQNLLGLCLRLLGLYLVIGAGINIVNNIESQIPSMMAEGNFDAYWWLASSVLLFWLLSKNIPEQFSRIALSALHETRGHDAAAIALATLGYTNMAASTATTAVDMGGRFKEAASDAFEKMKSGSEMNWAGMGIAPSVKAENAMCAAMQNSTEGHLSDQFRQLNEKHENHEKNEGNNKEKGLDSSSEFKEKNQSETSSFSREPLVDF